MTTTARVQTRPTYFEMMHILNIKDLILYSPLSYFSHLFKIHITSNLKLRPHWKRVSSPSCVYVFWDLRGRLSHSIFLLS